MRNPSNSDGFTLNNNGRNASASLNAGTVGTYLYNAFEQRAQKVAGGVTIQFVYDLSGHLIAESNGSGVVQREYIWLDDLPVAMLDVSSGTPVLYFIHTDQLGTPQKLTNSSSAIVWDGVFDPFGNGGSSGSALWGSVNWGAFSWGTTTSNLNRLRFPGQYADLETALNQNWHRDYDPTTGRYAQSDPIGIWDDFNTYAYVRSNPVKMTDPTGEQGLGGMLAGGALSFSAQFVTNLGKYNGDVGRAAACVNFTQVAVGAAAGLVFPGFGKTALGGYARAIGLISAEEFGQIATGFAAGGAAKVAGKYSLPPLRFGNACECN